MRRVCGGGCLRILWLIVWIAAGCATHPVRCTGKWRPINSATTGSAHPPESSAARKEQP